MQFFFYRESIFIPSKSLFISIKHRFKHKLSIKIKSLKKRIANLTLIKKMGN